ncbi:hypothetical protein Barb7_02981 [Bacteroidales bacterium Barb7]|nr:hypothetical protein Barb7_02981 [Bacteroidales bacterium Barb7]
MGQRGIRIQTRIIEKVKHIHAVGEHLFPYLV